MHEEAPKQSEKAIKMEVTEEIEQETPTTAASFNGNNVSPIFMRALSMNSLMFTFS